MSSFKNQSKISPAFQVMLMIILVFVGFILYSNWEQTGSFIGHGYSAENIESIEQDIRNEIEKKKGMKVSEVALIREIPTKLTGFVKVRLRSGKVVFQACTAKLGENGNSLWECKSEK